MVKGRKNKLPQGCESRLKAALGSLNTSAKLAAHQFLLKNKTTNKSTQDLKH